MNSFHAYVPTRGNLVALKVIRQTPEIDRVLPFTAPNGVLVKASPIGQPFVAIVNGRLTVSLRKPGAEPLGKGLEYGGRASDFGTVLRAKAAARETKAALKSMVETAVQKTKTKAPIRELEAGTNPAKKPPLVLVNNDPNFGG